MIRRLFDGGRRRPLAMATLMMGAALTAGAPVLQDAAERLVAGEALRQARAWAAGTDPAALAAGGAAAPGGPLRVSLEDAGRSAAGPEVRLQRIADPAGARTEATVRLRLDDAAGAAVTYDVSPALAAVRRALGLAALAAAALAVAAMAAGLRLRSAREAPALPGPAAFDAAAMRLRAANGGPLAVVSVDVDRFRAVSARLGDVGADAFMEGLATALRRGLGPAALIGRFGRDELVVAAAIGEAAALEACATAIAERLQPVAEAAGGASVSVGACLLEPGAPDMAEALDRARLALGEAKAAGGGRARAFSPEMERRVERRRRVERAVREGRRHGRFSLAFQPLVDARDGRTLGCEALMRLTDALGRAVPPSEFIPVAERTGCIDALGAWALREATAAAARWPAPLRVAVNLSVSQFRDGRLVERVEAALAASGLDPGRLELEVTESMLVVDPEGVRRQLDTLKRLGVTVAMDDFGTGYSSLAYLWHFGFDRLKLDRAFVEAIATGDARALDVTSAILDLAHRLGMEVTAEGVETEHEARVLADLGCDALQGFRFGRPMGAAELTEVMRWTADAEAETDGPAPRRAAG